MAQPKHDTPDVVAKNNSILASIAVLRDETTLTLRGKENELNILLNREPNPDWIKLNKYANNSKYLPIERLEWLMDSIFVNWHTEVRSVLSIANSVVVNVRVHFQDPITSEWKWRDGVGGAGLQTDKGEAASNFQALKLTAVEMGAPKAKTEAVKDAIGDIGRLFGRDLNRKDAPDYQKLIGSIPLPPDKTKSEVMAEILAEPQTENGQNT